MAQTYQPKDYFFSGAALKATTASYNASIQTDYNITGELNEIAWKWDNIGSIYITESGTAREVFRRNAPSGAAGVWNYAYPSKFTESTTGSIAGAAATPFIITSPLIINISGAQSGTIPLSVFFRYR